MIKEAIDRWEINKSKVSEAFRQKSPDDYKEVVRVLIENITSQDEYDDFNPDPERIHEIDDGHYQGTLVYVIGAKGYQPNNYWYVKVYYGSCSGCDTLQAIANFSDELPTDEQVKDYTTLALHVLQGLKQMGEDSV